MILYVEKSTLKNCYWVSPKTHLKVVVLKNIYFL